MKSSRRKRLEGHGWKIGSTAEFLGLTKEEQELLELKITLGKELKANRLKNKWTQVQFARMVRSSQSRVAKMESGDPSVSLDLLIKSLLTAGATRKNLAQAIGNQY